LSKFPLKARTKSFYGKEKGTLKEIFMKKYLALLTCVFSCFALLSCEKPCKDGKCGPKDCSCCPDCKYGPDR